MRRFTVTVCTAFRRGRAERTGRSTFGFRYHNGPIRPTRRRGYAVAAIVAMCLGAFGLAACGNQGGGSAQPCNNSGARPIHHVVIVMMENHQENEVIGNSAAPYITQLAHECATFTNMHVNGSPSYPNYLAITSGSTWGTSSDTTRTFDVANIYRQGLNVEYHDGATGCDQVGSDNAAKHEPRMSYADPANLCGQTQPLSAFDPNNLPTFALVAPTLCHDMHDCSVATGDAWLHSFLPNLLDGSDYASGDTLVGIVWDEPTPYANVWLNPAVAPGTVSSANLNHYSELKTVQDLLGFGCLANSCSAVDFRATLGL